MPPDQPSPPAKYSPPARSAEAPPPPAAAATERKKNQFLQPNSPNGLMLGFNLADLDEPALLKDGAAALYALGTGPDDYHPEREALVLVHGILGSPGDLQAIVDRFWRIEDFQLHVLCYDSFHRPTSQSGVEFAGELRLLADHLVGAGRGKTTILAHSLGGIVTRRALNDLSVGLARGAGKFDALHVVGIDNP